MNLLLNAVFKEEPEGGYSALCVELGVASQGETIGEARENLKEAIELYLESAEHLRLPKPLIGERQRFFISRPRSGSRSLL